MRRISPDPALLVVRSTEDEGMAFFNNLWARLSVLLGTVALAVFVPVAAWASAGPDEVTEAAAQRRGLGGFFGSVCCLIVIGIVVLVLLVRRNRRSKRR